MKIAGVWVNVKSLPTREVLIEQALKSKDYYQKKNALQLIEIEIDKSGLFNGNKKKSSTRADKPRGKRSQSSNRKKRGDSNKSKESDA